MIDIYKKGKDISVMVWAAFSGELGRLTLYIIDRDPKLKKGGTLHDLTFKFSKKTYLGYGTLASRLCKIMHLSTMQRLLRNICTIWVYLCLNGHYTAQILTRSNTSSGTLRSLSTIFGQILRLLWGRI